MTFVPKTGFLGLLWPWAAVGYEQEPQGRSHVPEPGSGQGRGGTEREAVTRVLPVGPGQILSPWATGSGPGTTLKSEAAAALGVPATRRPGAKMGHQVFLMGGAGEGQSRETRQGPPLGACFLEGSAWSNVKTRGKAALAPRPWVGGDACDGPGAGMGKGWKTAE